MDFLIKCKRKTMYWTNKNIYILATQIIEQLISKVTLQKQRTHASYTSLGTQTCRTDNTSNIRNPMSILPIKTFVWIVLHIFIGALEQLVRLDVVYQWIRVNKFHSVYLRLKLLSFVGQHNSFVCIMSPDIISVMSPSHICRRYTK